MTGPEQQADAVAGQTLGGRYKVIARGMAKKPDDRPATAGALVADMLRALGEPEPMLAAG